MNARIPLGAKVKVAHIYEMPAYDPDAAEEVRMEIIPNPHADKVGVVVGKTRRKVCKELEPESDSLPTPAYMKWTEETALFYVVRYTLTGRAYLTDANNIEVIA